MWLKFSDDLLLNLQNVKTVERQFYLNTYYIEIVDRNNYVRSIPFENIDTRDRMFSSIEKNLLDKKELI